jgi:hypothetical protein
LALAGRSYDNENKPTKYGYLVFESPPKRDGHLIPAFPKGMGNLVPYPELVPVRSSIGSFATSDVPNEGCLAMGLGFNNLTIRLGEEI